MSASLIKNVSNPVLAEGLHLAADYFVGGEYIPVYLLSPKASLILKSWTRVEMRVIDTYNTYIYMWFIVCI